MSDHLDRLDEDAVMIPKCEWESAVISCFSLSIKGGMSGAEIEYMVVRDFCKKSSLDSIQIYQVLRQMVAEYNQK